MTDTTPMRERMIAALDHATAEWVKAQGGDKGMADMPTEVLVDALLDVLEAQVWSDYPEEIVLAGETAGAAGYQSAAEIFTAMVKAIRGGA